ncbi:7088_t:CDS:2 [Cetraspora pellucida]|uniref:7088_t:CDS:1 n=1 Tax=Cetraspora pellucida TaxID=1433469 RepID=A0ACA9KZ65_9GLOM|nr:7088_t:CDS:2 [Cetraspora pellucida]
MICITDTLLKKGSTLIFQGVIPQLMIRQNIHKITISIDDPKVLEYTSSPVTGYIDDLEPIVFKTHDNIVTSI